MQAGKDRSMKEYLLGIDIGTSACKIAVFRQDGTAVEKENGNYAVYYPKRGWAEQDPDEWWQAVGNAIKRIFERGKVRPENIAGIGIDGQSWSAIPIDPEGNVLSRTPIWFDVRSRDICRRLEARIGKDRLFDVAGNPLSPSYTTAKILWYKENTPEVYQHTDKILQSNSFIAYRLTGKACQDLSQGYGLHCFDMQTGSWDFKMAAEIGIPEKFLPEIVACSTVIGTVTKKASGETGLLEGTPVVPGGLDAACGTLGAGVTEAGMTQEQGGQAGGMSICMDEPKADPSLILGFHVVPGKWLLQGGTTGGGGVMRWLERELGGYERLKEKETAKSSLVQFNELAAAVRPGSDGLIFLPYMAGERSPIWDPDARGVYFGLDFSKTKGHLIRAAMEGVAFALKHNLDTAEKAGASVGELRAMGGSANSVLWTQIKSDITGKPIAVPFSDAATTLGAAILAGVGIGMYPDCTEAARQTVHVTRRHEPNPDRDAFYKKNYKIYLELYQDLKGLMKKAGERQD